MKTTLGFVLLTCCAVSALSLAEDANKSKPSATVGPPHEFYPTSGTTAATNKTTPATNTTTHAPNTTTHAPNTTTHAPNTTTHAPNTTTHAPNTTTHAPNTTTHAPNTTTTTSKTTPATSTKSPTTAPPGPTPVGNYTIKTGNKTCLMAQMALKIRLDKTNAPFIVQPRSSKVEGACSETRVNFTLTFREGSITFMFNKSITDNTVYVDTLSFNITYNFNGSNKLYTIRNESLRLFPAKIGHSYSCKNVSVYMGYNLHLDLSQDRMQAFNLTNNDYGRSDTCPADQPDYSVAIGVGVALLILIVIVLVVYMVSRKKRTDGYQSL